MAKSLIRNYTFTPGGTGAGTISFAGAYLLEEILLVTNVTDNLIIYNFSENSKGGSVQVAASEETTLTLNYDTSSMSATDELQIFVDKKYAETDFNEAYVDPVNKLRVSTPSNLIDTDFEYGLQPSKWETLEVVNNIPAFYPSQSDISIADVVSITSIANSDVITVTTSEAHGLTVGTPIDVRGLSSYTAEGKYLISKVPTTTTFVYNARSLQNASATLNGAYTTIVPGEFYTASDINFNKTSGITTDNASPSTLTINTDYNHGLTADTQIYLRNTIGSKVNTLTGTLSNNAADGRPVIDPDDTITPTISITTAQTETKEKTGIYSYKIQAADVDIVNNKILWANSNLALGDALLYIPSAGDTEIGGLQRFQIYYVKEVDADGIKLCETTGGTYSTNAVIALSSTGSYTFGKGQFQLVYEVKKLERGVTTSQVCAQFKKKRCIAYRTEYASTTTTNIHTRAEVDGTSTQGSGRDLVSAGSSNASNSGVAGNWGLSGLDPERWVLAKKSAGLPSANVWNGLIYNSTFDANFTFNKSGTVPDGYEFVEDFSRYENGGGNFTGTNTTRRLSASTAGVYSLDDVSTGSYSAALTPDPAFSETFSDGDVFICPLMADAEADTLFIPAHNLDIGTTVSIGLTSGNAIQTQAAASTATEAPSFTTVTHPLNVIGEIVSTDRIRMQIGGVNQKIRVADGVYTATFTSPNAFANSIFIEDHELVSGEAVTFSAGTGGVLPTLSTTAPAPTKDGSIAEAVFTATAEALDDIRTSMGADAANLLITGTNAVTPFDGTSTNVSSGTMALSHTLPSINVQHGGTNYNNTENLSTTDNSWSQEVAYNFMSGTPFTGDGYNLVQTKFEANQQRPYWITVFEIPDPSKIANVTNIQVVPNFTSRLTNGVSVSSTTNTNDFSGSTTVLANGWRYTHDGVFSPPNTSVNQQHGLFSVSLIIDNTNYSGHSTTYSQGIVFNGTNSDDTDRSGNFSGFGGSRYLVNVLLPVKSGADSAGTEYGLTSGSITHVDDIAEKIAFKVRDNVIAATYGSPTTNAKVKVIDSDRIALQNTDGILFNFTNSGTAPLNVNLGTTIGALDGTHTVSSTTSNSFSFGSNSTVPPRTLEVPGTDISNIGSRCIFNVDDHSLDLQQEVVFSDPGSAFTGLTDGTTYFAIPLDKNNFEIATTANDALNSIGVSVTAPLAGNYSFSVSGVNGLIPGAGLISTTLGSIVVTGNDDCLFKQYFKSGDIIYIVDSGTTPGRIKQFTISSIPENNKLNLTTNADFTATNTNYLVRTAAYVRPDGTFIHRPFDGGVEITAGSSPNSKIIRQTRKYFRYQSGKGLQCSIAINFNPARSIQSITADTTTQVVTITTSYPHGLSAGDAFVLRGITSPNFNGQYQVVTATDFTFTFNTTLNVNTSLPTGIGEWAPVEWTGASVRCGMFDDQNGFFYEYDGQTLKACRRDSVTQLSGTAAVSAGSNVVTGTSTSFTQQLSVGENIVIRGQTYKITSIDSPTVINIQPTYRGTSQQRVIITKTIDTKVPQSSWNLDTADGNGPSKFNIDPTKIQMVYMDYSWYGAGKIRFGFKDTEGKVRYMHQFVHNNQLNEAYMRSGNLPGRYEIENNGVPTYVPTLFHWGTSIIMDGGFDDDKAYLFTAPSNTLQYTNGIGTTATTTGNSSLISRKSFFRNRDWYVRIPFSTADASKFSTGILLYGNGLDADGEPVAFTDYANGDFNAYIFVQTSKSTPSAGSYSSVTSGTAISIGAPSGGSNEDLELLVDLVPIVSIRLAPSVDNNLTGAVGDRDIINRMQLQLKQLGINSSHNVEIELILNGSLSTINYENVQSPSLSQLIKHEKGDTIVGGTPVFSLRASGGQVDSTGKRNSESVDFDLSKITDLGNSILGGDNVFPNGPDLITIAARIVDTAEVTTDAPFKIAGRLTWTESQA